MSHLRPALVLLAAVHGPDGSRLSLCRHRASDRLLFPAQADGSLVVAGWPDRRLRPDRAGVHVRPLSLAAALGHERAPDPADPTKTVDAPYNAAASTGSNLGPTSREAGRSPDGRPPRPGARPAWRSPSPATPSRRPAAASTRTSRRPMRWRRSPASPRPGIFPRRRSASDRDLDRRTRTFGIFGEPRVNVLRVNRALDRLGS